MMMPISKEPRSYSHKSLTVPKTQRNIGQYLFPFFSNMIAEGENKKTEPAIKIDEKISLDY